MKKLIPLTIFFLAICWSNRAYAGIIIRPVINTGLVGYWSFNEGTGTKVGDMSGKGNNGTWSGAGATHWADGKIGKAGNFNGSDDYVSVPYTPSLQLTHPAAISFWANLDSMGGSEGGIVNSGTGGSVANFAVIANNDGRLKIFDTTSHYFSPNYYLPRNEWVHVVVNYLSSSVTNLYVNGQYYGTTSGGLGSTNMTLACIGVNCYFSGSENFGGKIDEVRIYNRDLDASEIKKLYDSGLAKIGINQLGLVDPRLPSNATISYVREDCTGYSPCYHSLEDWETGFGGFGWDGCTTGDLTCLGKVAVAKIDGAWNSPDPDNGFTINGWVTDSGNYIYMYTTTSARHPGKWDETKYRLETTGSTILINDEYVRISGLQIKMTTASDYQRAIMSNINNANSDARISDNIIRGVCSDSIQDCTGIGTNWDSVVNIKIWNNILYNLENGIYINQGAIAQVYNNTVVDGLDGYTINGIPIVIAKNNLAYNNTDNYDDGGGRDFDDYSANNLSGPGTDDYMPTTNSRNGVQVHFVDYANDDFHLSPADSGARNYGTDLSNDASISYPFDIDRQARKGTWDIGADEARGTISGASQANQITNGLVGFWSFNGPDIDGNLAYDRSGQSNNGTISGATPIDGKVGQALNFDGTDDYVYAADSASLLDLPNGAFSYSAWIKVNNNGTLGYLLNKCQSSTTNGWIIETDSWRRIGLTIQRQTTDLRVFTLTDTLPSFPGDWIHIAVVYPGGDTASNVDVYLNGSEITAFTSQQDGEGDYMSDSGQEVRIGRSCYNSYATVKMDEVRLYNRVLSAEEIQRLYNLGR